MQMEARGEAPDTRIGKTYGGCRIEQRVADGAMGRVYAAQRLSDNTKVAVKVLHDNVARDHVAVERFKREFETARDLESPYVVRVHDFGETGDGSYFLSMEFLVGEELGTLLRREGKISLARALRIAAQMGLGLEDAHSFGVVHRDLKPDNLFLCATPAGDEVRILDFGSVKLQMDAGPKLTAFGTTLGSPYYMSPEQAMGKGNVDNRTDIFAEAAIVYEAIAGKTPYEGASVAQILMKIVNEMPAPVHTQTSGVPERFSEALNQAMAKDKAQRPRSAVEFVGSLLRALGLASGDIARTDVETWAKKTVAELQEALAKATPSATVGAAKLPDGATSGVIAKVRDPKAESKPAHASEAPAELSAMASGTSPMLWVGLALVGLVIVAGLYFAFA